MSKIGRREFLGSVGLAAAAAGLRPATGLRQSEPTAEEIGPETSLHAGADSAEYRGPLPESKFPEARD